MSTDFPRYSRTCQVAHAGINSISLLLRSDKTKFSYAALLRFAPGSCDKRHGPIVEKSALKLGGWISVNTKLEAMFETSKGWIFNILMKSTFDLNKVYL